MTPEEYELEKQIPTMSQEELKRQPWGFERIWPFGSVCDLVDRYEHQDENPIHHAECHIIRLGDAVFATNPFELFMDYGARIRARSEALQTFLVQLADGSGKTVATFRHSALSKAATTAAVIKSNWVGPEGGQMLVEETLASISELFVDESYPKTR